MSSDSKIDVDVHLMWFFYIDFLMTLNTTSFLPWKIVVMYNTLWSAYQGNCWTIFYCMVSSDSMIDVHVVVTSWWSHSEVTNNLVFPWIIIVTVTTCGQPTDPLFYLASSISRNLIVPRHGEAIWGGGGERFPSPIYTEFDPVVHPP